MLVLLDLAFGLIPPHLLIERIKQLLPGGGTRERRAVIKSSAKAPEIEQSLRSAVEGHTHAVQQIDDAGRGLAHGLDRRLIGQKIAAINRVVKVLPGGVALALQVLGCVDSTLRAHRVRALHRNDGEQVDLSAHFRDLDDRGQSRQPAADHHDFRI